MPSPLNTFDADHRLRFCHLIRIPPFSNDEPAQHTSRFKRPWVEKGMMIIDALSPSPDYYSLLVPLGLSRIDISERYTSFTPSTLTPSNEVKTMQAWQKHAPEDKLSARYKCQPHAAGGARHARWRHRLFADCVVRKHILHGVPTSYQSPQQSEML